MLLDPVAVESLAEVFAVDAAALSHDELGAAATRLGVLLDRAHAKLVELTTAAEMSSAFAREPFAASTRDWLQRRTVARRQHASADALLARDLIPLEAIRTALADGVVTVEEARVLCRPMRNPRVRRIYPLREADVLSEMLRLDRGLWERCMTIVIDRLDQDGPPPGAPPDGNTGHLDRKMNGRWSLDADLDVVDGAFVGSVIESIVRQLRHDAESEGADAPTRSQLVGEAIAEMARRAQASERHNQNTVPVTVIADEDTVEHLDDPVHVHEGGCCRPATIDGMPLTRTRLRVLLCHSILRGIVVGSDGAILRLGTTTREPSLEQRLYLALRDGGCTFPGCSQPPCRTQAHHIRWVSDQGPTDHDNLCLACPRHHALIHAGLWSPRLNVDQSVTWTHHRTGRQETRHPPRFLSHLAITA